MKTASGSSGFGTPLTVGMSGPCFAEHGFPAQ